jgi:hypothetical protein
VVLTTPYAETQVTQGAVLSTSQSGPIVSFWLFEQMSNAPAGISGNLPQVENEARLEGALESGVGS